MRIVHTADVHLDTPFPGRTSELRARLQAASRGAFERVVQLALAERANALVIAGDLFDGARLSFPTERFLVSELERLEQAGVSVVYATGNHDAASIQQRAGAIAWPSNVAVVSGPTPQRFPVFGPDGDTLGFVTAVGHAGPRETDDLSRAMVRVAGAQPEVALLHSQVSRARGSDRHRPYAPSELAHLMGAGFDYWALGHVHQRQTLWTDPLVCYSGNPQGRSFSETGARGCLLVDLRDRKAPLCTFHETALIRWEILVVEGLEAIPSSDGLVRHVTGAWEAARRGDPGEASVEWVVRVELRGPTPLAGELRNPEEREYLAEELAAAISALHVELWISETHAPVDVAAHAGRDDTLGEALRLIEGLRSGRESLDTLLPDELAGLDPASGVAATTYAGQLLAGAPAELLTRLLRDQPAGDAK